jgi:hypothetical protein
MTTKDVLLTIVESTTEAPCSYTSWESHADPVEYMWQLALLAYGKEQISREFLLGIKEELSIPNRKFNKDFFEIWDWKECC